MPDKLKLDPLDRPVTGHAVQATAQEIRKDEQAARVRDYGPADATTPGEPMKEGSKTYNATAEFGQMLADIAVPPRFEAPRAEEVTQTDYDRELDRAAMDGANRQKGKDHGPER